MPGEHRWTRSLGVLAALALPLGAAAQEIRLGHEFQVNTYTTSYQNGASLAVDDDGDFIVAWTSNGQDGSATGIFARRFSSVGTALGGEIQINTHFTSSQTLPSAAADADGDFVVAWSSQGQDGAGLGVFARRFSSEGAPVGAEFQVNTYITNTQSFSSVAAADSGAFVVVWQSYGQDGEFGGIFARRFSSVGAPVGVEFQVNTHFTATQNFPAVAADAAGNFVVAWESFGQDGDNYGIFAQRFSSAGVRVGSEFQVNTYITSYQRLPSVAADADGDFVIAWTSYGQDGSYVGVFARRFSSAGAPVGSEFQVNTYFTNNQHANSVASASGGDFVVAWTSYTQDENDYGVFARRFSSAGAPLATEFQVNTHTTNYQRNASVAAEAGGGFVVAWASGSQDGQSGGVFAQRFAIQLTLDIDGNRSLQPLFDGLLVVRRFFGFSGATLTTGAVGGGCTRCDAAAIEPYIAGLGLTLDIDGDGALEPLTDGLLILRALIGFTGATLTSGAVGGGCSRCDATAIEPYLAGLMS